MKTNFKLNLSKDICLSRKESDSAHAHVSTPRVSHGHRHNQPCQETYYTSSRKIKSPAACIGRHGAVSSYTHTKMGAEIQ